LATDTKLIRPFEMVLSNKIKQKKRFKSKEGKIRHRNGPAKEITAI
jgi:hypothetical protein